VKPKLYLINGPLGAGKTTALKHLLGQDVFRTARIIENEFANYSVDSDQLHDHEDKIQTIAGVCICCSTGDELVDALSSLASNTAPVIIEATGVANSLLLIEKLVLADMFSHYDLAHGLFVLDGAECADDLEGTIAKHGVELLAADTILISKSDLISADELTNIQNTLYHIGAEQVLTANEGSFDLSVLDTPSEMLGFYANYDEELKASAGDMSYTVLDLSNQEMHPDDLESAWSNLREEYGLRRLKGDFVDTEGKLHHVEATPKQFRLSVSSSPIRNLVLIGTHAQQLTPKHLRDAAA